MELKLFISFLIYKENTLRCNCLVYVLIISVVTSIYDYHTILTIFQSRTF